MSDEIIIREADLTSDGDLHYILSSWLKTYREEGKFTRRIRPSIFYKNHEAAIKRMLPKIKCTIACSPAEPNVILGYRVTSKRGDILHWIFVRQDFRNLGIAKKLMSDFKLTACEFSHWTLCCDELINRLLEQNSQMIYNPYSFHT